ncbi:MAG: hypothetical protein K2X38_20070 [Gemmataceae bacterium]|nr:hypothetical protein [Gemmataceae bacterium]
MSPNAQVVVDAAHALKRSFYASLRRLQVEKSEDALIVTGRVPSWYLKQVAQETIMSVRGSLRLENRVFVEN